ncbi:hypothetical protein EV175_004302 [Coemansia sp. RSA 1933]|nr:hypothetical protein EV175_004302 [Coemansia sp. RSA 1933]
MVDRQNKFVLHRDVSMDSLMVGNDDSPYVIDWGCGRVCTDGEEPRSAGKHIIGTATYVGIRILANCKTNYKKLCVPMPCLEGLHNYVKENSAHRISFSIEPKILPSDDRLVEDDLHASSDDSFEGLSDESDIEDLSESPTLPGSEKRPLGSLTSPRNEKRQR